jgi:transcription-repair coupling factor (superfamily II helicase)
VPVQRLLSTATIRALARSLGVLRVSFGPQGVALAFRPDIKVEAMFADALSGLGGRVDWNGERLLYRVSSDTAEEQREITLDLLSRLA